MTISSSSNTAIVQGNGLATSFSFPFLVPANSELFVYLTTAAGTTSLLPPSQYTVTGIAASTGGAITYPLSGVPLPQGSYLTIQRILPYVQLTDIVNQSGFYPDVIEAALDYVTMLTQQLAQSVALSIQVPISPTPANLTLPAALARANQLVGFDLNGNVITFPVTASVGAGNMVVEGPFVAGVNFTPGTTTTLPLSQNYSIAANVTVHFDGTYQGPDQYTINSNEIIFSSPIPVGVQKVYIVGGTTLSISAIPNGSVGSAALAPGAVTAPAIAAGAVTDVAISPSSALYSHVYSFVGSKDAGATGNGTTDDHADLLAAGNTAASLGEALVITPGTYLVGSSISFTAPVRFLEGAQFIIPNGVVVGFGGGLKGPIAQIFKISGTGAVTINGSVSPRGYAEWWGAETRNTGLDNAPLIMAAHAALVDVRLMPDIYYTASTTKFQLSGHTVKGSNPGIAAGNPVFSQIIIQSATLDIAQIGPDTQPATLTQTNTSLIDVTLGRSVAPSMAATPAGLRTQFCTWAKIDNIYTYDSRYGFVFTGTTEAHVGTINASRYTAGVGGTDQFYGVLIDGSANIGFAGGNASFYLEKAVIGAAIAIADSQGVVASGTYGYSDSFIRRIETGGLNIGINFIGNGNTGTYDVKNEDVHISSVYLDTCSVAGIQFVNTSVYGAIRIDGGFVAFNSAAASPTGIVYSTSKGSVEVTGVQVNCGTNPSATCFVATNSDGINQHDNFFIECAGNSGVGVVTGTSNSTFADKISNFQASGGAVPMITIGSNVARNTFDMALRGNAGKFSVGYALLDTTPSVNEFKCSKINPGVTTSADKILYVSTPITVDGAFGNGNLASGIMG